MLSNCPLYLYVATFIVNLDGTHSVISKPTAYFIAIEKKCRVGLLYEILKQVDFLTEVWMKIGVGVYM